MLIEDKIDLVMHKRALGGNTGEHRKNDRSLAGFASNILRCTTVDVLRATLYDSAVT